MAAASNNASTAAEADWEIQVAWRLVQVCQVLRSVETGASLSSAEEYGLVLCTVCTCV